MEFLCSELFLGFFLHVFEGLTIALLGAFEKSVFPGFESVFPESESAFPGFESVFPGFESVLLVPSHGSDGVILLMGEFPGSFIEGHKAVVFGS